MDEKLVLVVDDEPAIANFVSMVLEEAGYQTALAHSGMDALSSVLKSKPDVIVLDVRMPLMTGWNVVKHLHYGGFADIPIIAMSADYMVGEDANQYPIFAFLDKPFLPEALLDLVERGCQIAGHTT